MIHISFYAKRVSKWNKDAEPYGQPWVLIDICINTEVPQGEVEIQNNEIVPECKYSDEQAHMTLVYGPGSIKMMICTH
ncbi:hypothetical protein NC651_001242 [Populus alba x Populus x berolinensis]|nr:hypothetical protein NC651_001242 [Populus alba x Populus x berolinensis]